MSYVIELTAEERDALVRLLGGSEWSRWSWRESLLRKLTEQRQCVVFDDPARVDWQGYDIGGEG